MRTDGGERSGQMGARCRGVLAALSVAGLVTGLGAGCVNGQRRPTTAKRPAKVVSEALPGMVLERLGGAASSVPALAQGHVTVIDMWASWCVACKDTTARVTRMASAYRDSELVVIGINVGEPRSDVERALASGPPFPTLLDERFKFSDAVGAHELPTVLVVSPAGRIVHRSRTLDQATLDVVKGFL